MLRGKRLAFECRDAWLVSRRNCDSFFNAEDPLLIDLGGLSCDREHDRGQPDTNSGGKLNGFHLSSPCPAMRRLLRDPANGRGRETERVGDDCLGQAIEMRAHRHGARRRIDLS